MALLFRYATAEIKVDGVEIVPVELKEALDGKDTADYVSRVEPSAQGGEKMARLILRKLGLIQ